MSETSFCYYYDHCAWFHDCAIYPFGMPTTDDFMVSQAEKDAKKKAKAKELKKLRKAKEKKAQVHDTSMKN